MTSQAKGEQFRTTGRRSGHFSSPAQVLCLVVGTLLSGLIWQHFAAVDQDRLQERLLRGTQTLAAYSTANGTSEGFPEVATALTQLQQLVLQGEPLDESVLQRLRPGAPLDADAIMNLRYLARVRLDADSGRYLMHDQWGGSSEFPLPITDARLDGPEPASDRGEYYPVLLNVSTQPDSGLPAVMGLNHFYDDQFHLAMDQARDSGRLTSRTSFPLLTETEPFIIAHYYLPLYSPGALPDSIGERRRRHVGFVSAVSFVPAEPFIDLLPESYLGLEAAFIPHSPAMNQDNYDADVQAILASGGFAHEEFVTNGNRVHIFARPSGSLSNQAVTPTRWWALSIGLLLTGWVYSLLYIARVRSGNLEQMVVLRTLELQDHDHKLSETETRYRMLAENVSDVIYTHDLAGICTYVSPSVTQQLGYLPEQLRGNPIYDYMGAESAAQFRNSLASDSTRFDATLRSVSERTFEVDMRCADGSMRHTENTITLLRDGSGRPQGFLAVSRDITERKSSERERAGLEAAFHQSQKMEAIGNLAGGIAHDFNNLLTGILGHAELLKTLDSTREQRFRSIDTIETAALRARELTTQLLGFARKGPSRSEPVNMKELVQESIALLERTFDKNVSIRFSSDEQAPCTVLGDPGQLSQVLLNLAVNARDAMPQGGQLDIRLSQVSAHSPGIDWKALELDAGDFCRVDVRDTGSGIAAEDLQRIFEPFYTSKPQGKGTGLGLAMVYSLARHHGGRVLVESQPGVGSTFSVLLPLAATHSGGQSASADHSLHRGKGHILVIDDESIVRELAGMMLQKLGYHTHFAEDGLRGVEYYREHMHELDLVIVDLNMPNMGGIDCAQHLMQLNPAVRLVMATGYSSDSLQELLQSPNVCGFLQKPFMLQELSALLARCMAPATSPLQPQSRS